MISELFKKCEKAQDDSLAVIKINPESNNEVDYEETSGKKRLMVHAAATSYIYCLVYRWDRCNC